LSTKITDKKTGYDKEIGFIGYDVLELYYIFNGSEHFGKGGR
jgi:hypothetical protein